MSEQNSGAEPQKRQYHRLDEQTIGLVGGFEDVDEMPTIKRERERTNPFDTPVWESFESGRAKTTLVEDADAAVRAIRNAANHLNIGVSVRKEDADEVSDSGAPLTRIFFCGQEKRGKAA